MLKIYNLPQNKKTLFLRNLETILISSNHLESGELHNFRNKVAHKNIDILEHYKFSCIDESDEGLRYQFIANSIAIRQNLDDLSKTFKRNFY